MLRRLLGGDFPPAIRPLLVISLVGSAAGSMFFSFLGIWAVRRLGASEAAIGWAFAAGAVLSLVGGYVGGHISDHVGRRPVMLAGWAAEAVAGLLLLAASDDVLAGLCLFAVLGFFFSLGGAADQAIVADLVAPEEHERAYAAVRIASNLGVVFGPPIGAVFLQLGWNSLFLASSALAASGAVLAWFLIPQRGQFAPEAPPQRGSARVILADRPFLLFAVGGSLACVVYAAYETVLPISLVQSHGISPSQWGYLIAINPALVTLVQFRLTRRTERIGATTKLVAAMALMGLPYLALAGTASLPVVAAVLAVFVIGEMLWVPTSQAVIAALAPEDLRGAYMGGFSATFSIGFALAPLLGLQVRAHAGDAAMWVVFAVIAVVAGAAFMATGSLVEGRRAAVLALAGRHDVVPGSPPQAVE